LVLNIQFWVQNNRFKDFFEILFSLKGSFWGQKESFKAILGPMLGFFYCYYNRLPWPDPKYMEKISRERQVSFEATDFITLDIINRDGKLPQWARDRLPVLLKSGVVERIGRKYILSRKYYEFVDRKGVYTRKRGLDRETNKQLSLKHIKDNKNQGSKFRDLKDVLPSLSRDQVKKILAEMKKEGKIYKIGATRAALWYPENKGSIVPIREK